MSDIVKEALEKKLSILRDTASQFDIITETMLQRFIEIYFTNIEKTVEKRINDIDNLTALYNGIDIHFDNMDITFFYNYYKDVFIYSDMKEIRHKMEEALRKPLNATDCKMSFIITKIKVSLAIHIHYSIKDKLSN
jgi:hypothetical protein